MKSNDIKTEGNIRTSSSKKWLILQFCSISVVFNRLK